MRFALVMLVLALAAVEARAGQGAAPGVTSQPKILVEFKDSVAYKTGREVELKTVVLRRTMKSVPKEWIEYAKMEVWMSNTELDVCSLPELGDVADLPLGSDDAFVLVWEGASPAPRRAVYTETPVAQALFSDTWLEAYGKPIVLLWHQGASVASALREVLEDAPVVVQMGMNKAPSSWSPGGKDQALSSAIPVPLPGGVTLVRALGLGNWHFHHAAVKGQRHRERSFAFVTVRKVDGQGRMRFSGSKAAKLSVEGEVPLTKTCPEIREDKRFWLDGKVYSR